MSVTGSAPTFAVRVRARLTAVLLLMATVAVFLFERAYRVLEIEMSAVVLRMVSTFGVSVDPARPAVYFGLGSDHALGLTMTPECTSAFLILPLFVVAAVLVLLRPPITGRVLRSLGLAALILFVVNQLRILALAGLVDWLGTDRGYYWGHTLMGSVISIIGGAAALVLFVWLATKQKTPAPARRAGTR
nr:exosortase P [Kibdelosporangium sp. MJ126-NF4]CEL23064.1 hypothetical protein [Kibdelosporangium sp. MJ126-NF4]CTQ90202.1 hypothetical protein [Kibdelosporangium sp. MJ126-NF4]